ncbi:YqgE/AlgH family protein [Parendozoicomonas haliclonae]|uniref:UPF0301 protein EHSB41UT_02083 n=1 Tax=Parendozoicomonas haliclonae TaxID=1960125 RepID=A0A1X7AJ78_9GAMM|nr:YqgE/AlgH family protein [Parendozoicomonas haliclonae]SMA46113.1 hypothetical protein EHSB41UT_02083 [Parendozoicomonas haliclonae]
MLMTKSSLRNTLLIAMPQLEDENFSGSVIYICEHNEDGAMGLIINRPLSVPLHELFNKTGIAYQSQLDELSASILYGGPVDIEHGFILHTFTGELDERASIPVTHDIALTSSRELLEDMGQGNGPQYALVSLGYAGWGPGQLEQELADNAWLNSPADKIILFQTPYEQRLERACTRIGVDLAMLSHEAGHA